MSWPDDVDGVAVQRVLDARAMLALERSSSDLIQAWQRQQLAALVQWLLDHVPPWRTRLGPRVDLDAWHTLPILSRFDMRQINELHGAALVPAHHGAVAAVADVSPQHSGARTYVSAWTQRLANHAFYADHERQGRNPYLPQATISEDVPLHSADHVTADASLAHGTGQQALRNFGLFTKAQHLKWIVRQRPAYLTVRPDWFEVALVHAAANQEPLPEIRQILTFGATATDSLRRKARKWLGASVRHRYTCPSCGPAAFQCPHSDDYHHVAVANVKLEVVDEVGNLLPMAHSGTAPKAGRVLLTALHQYATPLIRYDTGDQAALHDGCPACGLAVPSLSALRHSV